MTDISGYTVVFNEHMVFRADTPRHRIRETDSTIAIHKCNDVSCLRLSNRQIEGELVLPALPPDTGEDEIIRVSHCLKIDITVNGCHEDRSISVPIFIGTVPLRETLGYTDDFTPIAPTAPMFEDSGDNDSPPGYESLSESTYLLRPIQFGEIHLILRNSFCLAGN